MERLGCISFAALDGEPSTGESLDSLPAADAVAGIIRTAFAPFLIEDSAFHMLDGVVAVEPPTSGLILVYAYGHAWLRPDGPYVATRSGATSRLEDASELLARLVPTSAVDRTILILDCCHAAAFDSFIMPSCVPRLVVYACGADEKAIALIGDQASRLSLTIADKLASPSPVVDLVRSIAEVAERLDTDGVLRGQTVSYRMNGLRLQLSRSLTTGERRRGRTVAIIRNALLASGALVAAILVAISWYYWNHTLVDVDLAGLHGVARDIRMVATEEDPAINESQVLVDQSILNNRTRLWVPASNVLLRVQAFYGDGAERALTFHLNLEPSIDPSNKSLSLALPPAEEIRAHPNMAFVPATKWFHGREREPRTNARPYWIDLRPPTIAEYLPIADALLRSGKLDAESSFVLSARQRSSAIDEMGLGQLRSLNEDLGAIFGAIEQGTSPRVAAPGDIAVGLGDLPCETCPAPMTRHEAEIYCKSREMRLPTDLEWELAVRGVDGRVYPWGNQFDEDRANVPGLPEKGDPPPTLKPVDAYPDQRSPFGLIDTVGNAGDWVVNETGSYERVYMGATYRYNQEDATAFRMLPVTEEDYLVREITARCVADTTKTVKQ